MPFKVENDWTTVAGLRAVVILGHRGRCGYVGVLEGSAFYRKGHREPLECISQELVDNAEIGEKSVLSLFCGMLASEDGEIPRSLDLAIDCHGSLTYSGGDNDYPVAGPEWWFGFDCTHYGDGQIGEPFHFLVLSQEFCEAQCEKIAQQLASLEPRQ